MRIYGRLDLGVIVSLAICAAILALGVRAGLQASEAPPTPADCQDPMLVGVMLKEPGTPSFRSNVQFPDYTTHERMEIYRCASGYAWFSPVELVERGKK